MNYEEIMSLTDLDIEKIVKISPGSAKELLLKIHEPMNEYLDEADRQGKNISDTYLSGKFANLKEKSATLMYYLKKYYS